MKWEHLKVFLVVNNIFKSKNNTVNNNYLKEFLALKFIWLHWNLEQKKLFQSIFQLTDTIVKRCPQIRSIIQKGYV